MKLEKAIEIKGIFYKGGEAPSLPDYRKADLMSIEALQRVKWHKEQHRAGYYELLPGETKE